MLRFFAGFAFASALWGGFLLAYSRGYIDISLEPEAPSEAMVAPTEAAPDDDKPDKARRRRTSVRGQRPRSGVTRTGDSMTGDDLGEDGPRDLDVGSAGGEQQLKGSEIEQGFDAAFPQIRRCFILAASDDPVRGKLTFGLRISGEGRVSKVNLSGPSALTQGDAGSCLRQAASGMHFRAFHGPDMVVHYPVTLD